MCFDDVVKEFFVKSRDICQLVLAMSHNPEGISLHNFVEAMFVKLVRDVAT